MALADLLKERRAAILKRWLRLIIESYPPDTARFLEQEGDRFLNPVGYTFTKETECLLDEILKGGNSEKLTRSLDNIVKIRTVQDFSPSRAIAPIFMLKRAVREELGSAFQQQASFGELQQFDSRIDGVALLAFDSYMQCKQKIFDIRVNEASKRSAILLERLNRIYGNQEGDAGLDDPASDHVSRGSTR
ncbi:MAG: RsbRD N-terminal domain-containing protein [Chloroflexota bacterium]|jgi:hypothetical protein